MAPIPGLGEDRFFLVDLCISCRIFTGLGGRVSPYIDLFSALKEPFSLLTWRLMDSSGVDDVANSVLMRRVGKMAPLNPALRNCNRLVW